jgi:hypothetical protein
MLSGTATLMVALVIAACSSEAPTAPVADARSADRHEADHTPGPTFDLNVKLRGDHRGEGFIRFRQPDDGLIQIQLDTRIEGLQRNHDYYLQRAALVLGSGCVDSGWLTLGLGTVVTAIHTGRGGEGRAMLYRNLPPTLVGTSFDIHFQVIDAVTNEVVLRSRCYQYTVSAN